MALIPALLTLSGVGRSGSPADRSMMLRPWALSSRALVDIAIVCDGEMRFTLSAKKPMGLPRGSSSGPAGSRSARDPTLHRERVKVKVADFARIGPRRDVWFPSGSGLLGEEPVSRLDRPCSQWSIG